MSLSTFDDPDRDEKSEVGVGGDRSEEREGGGDEDAQPEHPLAAVQLGQATAGVLGEGGRSSVAPGYYY